MLELAFWMVAIIAVGIVLAKALSSFYGHNGDAVDADHAARCENQQRYWRSCQSQKGNGNE